MNDKLRVIVAQPKEENVKIISEFLTKYGYETVGTTDSGDRAVKLAIDKRPDVIIADAYMYDLDVCGMIERLRERAVQPMPVIAVAMSIESGRAIENVLVHGVDIVTLIPFDNDYFNNKLRTLIASKRTARQSENVNTSDKFELLDYISKTMHEVGVPASISGYHYIRESIMMSLDNKRILKAITKELYPTIAKNNETTPSRVERAIRHAVEVAWQRGDVEVLNNIFGYTVKSSKGKPTNSEFISMLSERVRLDLKIS